MSRTRVFRPYFLFFLPEKRVTGAAWRVWRSPLITAWCRCTRTWPCPPLLHHRHRAICDWLSWSTRLCCLYLCSHSTPMCLRIVLRHQLHTYNVTMTYEENVLLRCCLVYIYLGPICYLCKITITAFILPTFQSFKQLYSLIKINTV